MVIGARLLRVLGARPGADHAHVCRGVWLALAASARACSALVGVVPGEWELSGRYVPEGEGRAAHGGAQAGHDAAMRLGSGERVQGVAVLPRGQGVEDPPQRLGNERSAQASRYGPDYRARAGSKWQRCRWIGRSDGLNQP